ncbi:MAG: hypothetical protein HZA68_17425 [Rhodovulum sp.]|nr:hypothetical protein [Rhodovulum sp.]
MMDRFTRGLLVGLLAVPSAALAQGQAPLQDRWPAPTQQMAQRAPAASDGPAEPAAKPRPQRRPQAQAPAEAPAAAPEGGGEVAPAAAPARRAAGGAKPAAASQRAIACSGTFAKSATHLSLAAAFDSKNITFTEVDGGPDGSKLNASVLFPDDPKRRLEVLWKDEGERANINVIVVTGQSTWTAPKGLKLGMPLAAVEKLNGKPFKLQGFDQESGGSVVDWQGGALASLPGGCNVTLRFAPGPKVPDEAKAQATGEGLVSSAAAVKAVKPVVAEILLGYP